MSETIATITLNAYSYLLPVAQLAVFVAVVILAPMATFRRTRPAASSGLIVASYVVGATTWFLGAGITFVSFGWVGLLIGLVVFGVGVVFLGMAGAGFVLGQVEIAWSLLVMSIITLAMRFGGAMLASQTKEDRLEP